MQVSELQLAHLEALHRQRAEVDAKHTGEMAFIKLHCEQQLEDLQSQHREEVRAYLHILHVYTYEITGRVCFVHVYTLYNVYYICEAACALTFKLLSLNLFNCVIIELVLFSTKLYMCIKCSLFVLLAIGGILLNFISNYFINHRSTVLSVRTRLCMVYVRVSFFYFALQIEQLTSEHHALLLALDSTGGSSDVTDVGGHSLLLKIAVSRWQSSLNIFHNIS